MYPIVWRFGLGLMETVGEEVFEVDWSIAVDAQVGEKGDLVVHSDSYG